MVPETLFIPLLAKAKETGRKYAVVKDFKACEIIRQVKPDQKKINGGIIKRVRYP